jgi:hypothetical protein
MDDGAFEGRQSQLLNKARQDLFLEHLACFRWDSGKGDQHTAFPPDREARR